MFPSQGDGCCSSRGQQQQQCDSCPLDEETSSQNCDESEALQTLCQVEKLYESYIAEVEADVDATDAQRTELKLKIMTDWVKDLREQNAVLVQTASDLEKVAVGKVKLLENKLQETSNLMSHNMSHTNKSAEDLNVLSEHIDQLVCNQDCMDQKIQYLHNDIKNLLKLIKRGRMENNWDLDGLTFHVIRPSDIPVQADCTCNQEKGSADNGRTPYFIIETEENERKVVAYQKELEDKIQQLRSKVNDKDKIIKTIKHRVKILFDYLNTKYNLDCQIDGLSTGTDNHCDIASMIDNEESACMENQCKIEKLREQIDINKTKSDEYKNKMKKFQKNFEQKVKENQILLARLKCLEKYSESEKNLAAELSLKDNVIDDLRKSIKFLEKRIQKSEETEHRNDRNINNRMQTARKVRISTELSQNLEDQAVEERLHDPIKQIEELKSLLIKKDNEISKLNAIINEKSNQEVGKMDDHLLSNCINEKIFEFFDTSLKSLEMDYQNVLKTLQHLENKRNEEESLIFTKLQDIHILISNYRSKVIEPDQSNDIIKEFVTPIEKKITHIQKLFKNQCEECIKENSDLQMKQIISKISSSIQTISKIYENKHKITSSIAVAIAKNSTICDKNTSKEAEQNAIFAALHQQFRMMEEFRICTVEVQAATEELREEMLAVISNLDLRHCKYIELTKMVNQVQEYLVKTRENISKVINCLELQNEERTRYSGKITNTRIKLKDIKNDFNQTQSDLSKCLNNVQNNIQPNNLLGDPEIYRCNNLLSSVTEEVEHIVTNLQTQENCILSNMKDFKVQVTNMQRSIEELKKTSDQVLLENEDAQKSFVEKSKSLEKYELEVDNCHTKMQCTLESILATQEQMAEIGCIKEITDSFQSTNEIIKLKDDLRKLQKQYEKLELKITEESHIDKDEKTTADWENRVTDLQNHIKVLESEIKDKQEKNILLKQSIKSLERELDSTHTEAAEYRRYSSKDYLELQKRNLELESCLRVQKGTENNLKCLTNNETDSKKSQQLLDCINKDRLYDSTLMHVLQGTNENIPQIFKVLQDTVHTIKHGLEEFGDELQKLVSGSSSHTNSANDLVRSAIAILAKYIESIKYCSCEIEKIKTTLYSKHKLMENMDEIIRIQKDSITISQSEVEDLHKTLHEKIETQEKTIFNYEKEIKKLTEQIRLQVQTIGHLQEAVVQAKRNIDQLTNKAASDEELKSQSRTNVNAKSKINELLHEKNNLKNKCQDANKAFETLKRSSEDYCKKLSSEKQCEIDALKTEINDLKKQLQVYKFDFDLIEEEMKKMGIADSSLENFKMELNVMRLENEQFRCKMDEKKKKIAAYKCVYDKLRKQSELLNAQVYDNEQQIQELQCQMSMVEEENKSLRDTINKQYEYISKLNTSNQTLKNKNEILMLDMNVHNEKSRCKIDYLKLELAEAKSLLKETQENYEKVKQCLHRNTEGHFKILERRQTIDNPVMLTLEANCNCTLLHTKNEDDKSKELAQKLTQKVEDIQEELSAKNAALTEAETKLEDMSNQLKTSQRNCKRQKDELELSEKRLGTMQQKFQSCKDKNEELLRHNKYLEDNYSKCMTELEDIVLQLEDMQRSLIELRTECDTKTQSLDYVSNELTKMKMSRSEVCEESQHVLKQIRCWMKQQKQTTSALQEKLRQKQKQLLLSSSDKKNLVVTLKHLKRENRIFTKRLKLRYRLAVKQPQFHYSYSSSAPQIHKSSNERKDVCSIYSRFQEKKTNAVYAHFKRESKKGVKDVLQETGTGDCEWFPTLKCIANQVPTARQTEDIADGGYQTSSSK